MMQHACNWGKTQCIKELVRACDTDATVYMRHFLLYGVDTEDIGFNPVLSFGVLPVRFRSHESGYWVPD